MPASPLKAALEDLLRARRLSAFAPPLRGEPRWPRSLPTGLPEIDGALQGGFSRGQLSEVHGPVSSGRTGIALALVARCTAQGLLAAWVDPAESLDPESAGRAGADLTRIFWLRGRTLGDALQATGTLIGSGLFEVVVLDVASLPHEVTRLPGSTWIRLQRMVAETKTALVLVASGHVACGPGGQSLVLTDPRPRWSCAPGPGKLLAGLDGQALSGRHTLRRVPFALES